MEKTTHKFSTIEEVIAYTNRIFDAYYTIYECCYIVSDGSISNDAMRKLNDECAAYAKGAKTTCPWAYYMGIRYRGVECGERAEYVREKIQDFNDKALAGIKVEYTGSEYIVTFNRK